MNLMMQSSIEFDCSVTNNSNQRLLRSLGCKQSSIVDFEKLEKSIEEWFL